MKNKKIKYSKYKVGQKLIVTNTTKNIVERTAVTVVDNKKNNKKEILVNTTDDKQVKIKTKYLTD